MTDYATPFAFFVVASFMGMGLSLAWFYLWLGLSMRFYRPFLEGD